MPSADYARVLARKAAEDEFVVTALLADFSSPDDADGFHAQQAVEKLLKAVLAQHGIPFRWRHDLTELIELLRDHQVPFPNDLEDIRRLTPFATEWRYAEPPPESEEPLDRAWAASCIQRTKQWAFQFVPRP